MDAAEFLGITPTHNPYRWVLPVESGVATAGRFLFGGAGLGAAICALEAATGRPVVWATAQYLSFAMVGEVVDIDVTIATNGHYTSQARVVGRVVDREIFTVNAALGTRPSDSSGQWIEMPEMAPPEASPPRVSRWDLTDTIMERIDIRLAKGRAWEDLDGTPSEDGRSALWAKAAGLEISAATLAILGDYVPFGIAQALGYWTRSNSLDNTLRIAQIVPTEWVLLDIAVNTVRNGFGHGRVHLWAADGTLLATASQSAVVHQLKDS